MDLVFGGFSWLGVKRVPWGGGKAHFCWDKRYDGNFFLISDLDTYQNTLHNTRRLVRNENAKHAIFDLGFLRGFFL